MKYFINSIRARSRRWFIILFALTICFFLLILNGQRFFAIPSNRLLAPEMDFGFAAFVALVFLAVGSLVLLYARDRLVASLLFCYSFTLMVSFATQTGAASNDPILSIIGDVSSGASPYFFLILVLLFPNDLFSTAFQDKSTTVRKKRFIEIFFRTYLVGLALLCFLGMLSNIFYYILPRSISAASNFINFIYFFLALASIIVTIIISYRRSTTRERQNFRLFVIGVVLAFAPFLLLTLLPLLLGLPQRYSLDSQISTAPVILLGIALGYSILRYQILVFDSYVRRAIAWIAGAMSLLVLGYLVVIFSSQLFPNNHTLQLIFIAAVLVVLVPFVWWQAHVIIDRLFFKEMLHYRRMIDRPDLLARETFDLSDAAKLLMLTVTNAFETEEVCLYVLDDESGQYILTPAIEADNPGDLPRHQLVERLAQIVRSLDRQEEQRETALLDRDIDWLEGANVLLEMLKVARRPLFLSEVARGRDAVPRGLERYLLTSPAVPNDALIVPVYGPGKTIGLLVLGERGDHQSYAGPDFEVIDMILSRFSPVLETARLYQQASRHVAILDTLFSASARLERAYDSVEDVAVAYAEVAVEAVRAGVEMWLLDDESQSLRRVVHLGKGPYFLTLDSLSVPQTEAWTNWFYVGAAPRSENEVAVHPPALLPEVPSYTVAWLPLLKGTRCFGVLVFTYLRPHYFSQGEKRVLSLYAAQCAAAMENAQITIELRAAYERQKELDRLKDQFIMTASHELRTPLTAVQGYIELLEQYNGKLSVEERARFIAQAQRGCDELVLMVNNIMDASRVQIDAEQVRLEPTSLTGTVQRVVEIVEGMARRESRTIELNIPQEVMLFADDLRLRQILLNLVSNAFKYSPPGSPILIIAEQQDENVTIRVRDFGAGITQTDQQRLFERFMRLERDMNSPVRGAGLGLYICKQLVDAMGGHIWIESTGRRGEGSTFAFSLKLYQPSRVLAQ